MKILCGVVRLLWACYPVMYCSPSHQCTDNLLVFLLVFVYRFKVMHGSITYRYFRWSKMLQFQPVWTGVPSWRYLSKCCLGPSKLTCIYEVNKYHCTFILTLAPLFFPPALLLSDRRTHHFFYSTSSRPLPLWSGYCQSDCTIRLLVLYLGRKCSPAT
jgi:hypothetical protein